MYAKKTPGDFSRMHRSLVCHDIDVGDARDVQLVNGPADD